MTEPGIEQIRSFRLHSHHLDAEYNTVDIVRLAGACGMQNSPPGAWETALFNRVPCCTLSQMQDILYKEKLLIQAWSLRGAPVVFPESESDVFLSALKAEAGETWIYTPGILLALDYLHMSFEELFGTFQQVMPRLDDNMIIGKSALDQTIADWMKPFLPEEKQELWSQPSMYGEPDRQTVGGAVASFMLRPASFSGMVVFAEREGNTPVFTSYKNWTGQPMKVRAESQKQLVRKFLHCYGPATVDHFISWLGCSGKQGRRMWRNAAEEMEPVAVNGKKAYILSEDRERLFSPASFQRELVLLGGHDPYLDQRDRVILQPDKSWHKQIWKMVTNPGAVVYQGEIIGVWNSRKKSKGMEIQVTLWKEQHLKGQVCSLAEQYADFRGQKIVKLEI